MQWVRPPLSLLSLVSAVACAGPGTLKTPAFAPPRGGVFNEPLAVVESTHDDMLPSVTPHSAAIAYASRAGGNLDVYLRPLAGGGAMRLTSQTTDDSEPALSPDGEKIAWTSQERDVKGDIWVMNANGGGKRQLTQRDTGDSAPTWAPDGETLYFTSRPLGLGFSRVESLSLATGERRVLAERAWDPAVANDGAVLFYVAFDERARPRLYAKRLADGRTAAITDGAHIEGMPRVAKGAGPTRVVFARWVDDHNADGVADADDAPSLWTTTVDVAVFAGAPPAAVKPLTAGQGGEIFASVVSDFFVYTTGGRADLDIYALPADGIMSQSAGAEVVFQVARSEDHGELRRLAWRYLIAVSPAHEARARYELARELVERGRLGDAIEELGRVVSAAQNGSLAPVASIERERLRLLLRLRGRLLVREDAERRYANERVKAAEAAAQGHGREPAVAVRLRVMLAEIDYALGRRGRAVETLETVAAMADVPAEDGARALDRLGEIYAGVRDGSAVARVSEMVLRLFAGERHYVRQAATRWIESAKHVDGVPPAAALQEIAQRFADLPALAARAAVALAHEQRQADPAVALAEWQRIAVQFAKERDILAEALTTLAEAAERQGADREAIAAYERLLAEFPDSARLRGLARRGISRLALRHAQREEQRGRLAEARASYARVVQNNPELVIAQRRYILLSARLGKLAEVLSTYAAAAKADPRDKLARYTYGYALSFERPPDLDDIEREMGAVLALDPRFAPAHLTRGWVRELMDRDDPKGGWLERADSSYETARSLLDPTADAELYAAALLNRGNVLFALGKTDDAFRSYLERELSGVSFDEPLTELLFRERFARVALREGAPDVALDMARGGERLARRLLGEPRRATMAGLVAAVSLETGMFEDAAAWYEQARALYAEQGDWVRVVPMLRGKVLALRLLGKDDDALLAVREVLALAKKGLGVSEPLRSLVAQLLAGEFTVEIPAVPGNVTRAIHGFTSDQEQEIAQALASRILRGRGDLSAAREADQQRMALVRREADDERLGPRTELELMLALHESALVAARGGYFAQALARWNEALPLARRHRRWADAAVMIEAVGKVSTLSPGELANQALAAARQTASDALKAPDSERGPALTRRLARWLSVDHFSLAQRAARPSPSKDFPALLAALDVAAKHADAALAQAELAGEAEAGQPDLRGHLARVFAFGRVDATKKSERVRTAPLSWRWRFDRALWDHDGAGIDPAWLVAAIEAFEHEPAPTSGSERGAFLAAATDTLVARGEVERAWQLMERHRLLDLEPPRARLPPALRARWDALVQARPDATRYAALLKDAPSLLRALAGRPVGVKEVQSALDGALLVQGFATLPDRVDWFVIDSEGVRHVKGVRPPVGELPAALFSEGALPASFYLDAGDLYDRPAWQLHMGGVPLWGRSLATEVLSATYLVAARDARTLTDDEVLALGETSPQKSVVVVAPPLAGRTALARLGTHRLLLHLALPAHADRNPFARAGLTQVTFATARELSAAERIDLDTLGQERLGSSMAVIDRLTTTGQGARAVAQAFLLAGVATTAVGDAAGKHLRDGLAHDLGEMRADAAFARFAAQHPGQRLWFIGHRGMDPNERIALAVQDVFALATAGKAAFEKARVEKRPDLWERAREVFSDFIAAVDFLMRPTHAPRLAASANPQAQRLAKAGALAALRTINRSNLAQIHLALGELDEASALQELVVQDYEQGGDQAKLAEALRLVGQLLVTARRYPEAARRYEQCVRVAGGAKAEPIMAECSLQLGLARRELFAYPQAVDAMRAAISLFNEQKAPKLVEAHRYLGFLYGDALNRYDDALREFEKAVTAAQHLGRAAMIAPLTLDVARIHRQRGDYEKALTEVRRAEAALKDATPSDRTEVALEFAKIHWYRGNYRRALERQAEALELARRAGDNFREIQAVSLAGLIALNQRELGRAERQISAALDLARISKRRREEATQLNNLGIVLREAGRIDEAMVHFHEALGIDEELGSSEGRAYDRRHLGVSLHRQGKHAEALQELERALSLSRAIGDRFNELETLFATGEALEALGRQEARAQYTAAAELARRIAVPEVEWRSLYALGRLSEAGGDTALARELLQRALTVAERLGRGRSEPGVERNRDDLYADAVRLAVAAGDLSAAYSYSERSRARALLDVLATRTIEFGNPRAKELLAAELTARETAVAAERHADLGLPNAALRLRAAKGEHAAAQSALRRELPAIARFFTLAPASLAELQGVLPAGAVVASYFVGRHNTTLFIISAAEVQVTSVAVGMAPLNERVRTLGATLRAFGSVDRQLAELSQMLAAPLAPALARAHTLVVLPHGPLHHVPFGALSLAGEPLITRWVVASALSGSALYDVLRMPAREAPHTVVSLAPTESLAFSRLESLAIAGNAAVLGAAATETRARQVQSDALNLAAHAELDPEDPLASAVIFAGSDADDGRLEVAEVFGLDHMPSLVTLSACTSAGSEVQGSEWLGLGGAFLSAGARTVVASHHRVSDLAAAVMMKRFYRELRGRPAGEALRAAALRAREYFPHPAHWAGFTLMGDFR